MADVRLQSVHKRFGKSVVVDDLSLEIRDGEFVVLLGPSGCGKTTTMRMIAGLEDATEGNIWIGARLVNRVQPKDRDVSMVFQSYGQYPNLSVYENIRFPLRMRRVPDAQHRERVLRAAATVELTPYLDRRPAQLSGGQRQRVALGRAIVREPAVFLMDEPLSNLDAKLRVSTRAQLKHLHHTLHTTTVYVTHDQIEAMTLADRVVVMNQGVIQQIATPSEVYGNPANTFVAGFIGSPAMNLIDGSLADGVFEAPQIRIPGLTTSFRGDVTLGFRAEDSLVTSTPGHLNAPVYSMELLGEATMVNFRLGEALVSVRAAKSYRADIAQIVHVNVPADACHLFDRRTGLKLT